MRLSKYFNYRNRKIGQRPGTLVHSGEKKMDKPRLYLMGYGPDNFHENLVEEASDLDPSKFIDNVNWLNVDGLHEVEVIKRIGDLWKIRPLMLEDVLTTDQRPKIESQGDHIIIILRMIYHSTEDEELNSEQFSIILGKNYVVSFQEKRGDVLEGLRNRLRTAKGPIRKRGADYLAYAMVDAVVDHYFTVLEKIGDELEMLEMELLDNPNQNTVQHIHSYKREMIYFRKSIWPLREVLSSMQRDQYHLISDDILPYIRDVYDHTIQVIDTSESFRDVTSGMLDVYLSALSNRTNEIMRVLTLFSAVFIPLTFIAGVYGMNFEHIPELKWDNGYWYVWGLMIITAVGLLTYFKRKRWL